ncbi:hypothetical protein [Chryseobacterium sp. 3008163]|nr:hypothetical protein [Chryseobacterium sp. 3008163]
MTSTSKTMNPFNNKLVKSFDEMTEEQLESKIKRTKLSKAAGN